MGNDTDHTRIEGANAADNWTSHRFKVSDQFVWRCFCDHRVAVDRPRLAACLRHADPSVIEFASPFIAWLCSVDLDMTVDDPVRLQTELLADWRARYANN